MIWPESDKCVTIDGIVASSQGQHSSRRARVRVHVEINTLSLLNRGGRVDNNGYSRVVAGTNQRSFAAPRDRSPICPSRSAIGRRCSCNPPSPSSVAVLKGSQLPSALYQHSC